jgi:hypothetical protein
MPVAVARDVPTAGERWLARGGPAAFRSWRRRWRLYWPLDAREATARWHGAPRRGASC